MHKPSTLFLGSLTAALISAAIPAMAQSKGDWTVGIGVGVVDTKSDSGSLVNGSLPTRVSNDTQPTFTAEYFILDNLGIEVLAATPFKHDISISALGGKVASTKQLPPVVSLQYHFDTASNFSPFVGVGVNYTKFFSVDTTGGLAGSDLDLDDSWGLALHAGLDYKFTPKDAVRVDVRWADIDTDVKLNGADIGTANIDPFVYGVSYVHTF